MGLIQQPLAPPHPNDHLCQYSCNVAKQPYDTGKFPLLFYTVLQRQKRQSIQEESRKLFRTYIHRMIRDSDRRKSGEKKKKRGITTFKGLLRPNPNGGMHWIIF